MRTLLQQANQAIPGMDWADCSVEDALGIVAPIGGADLVIGEMANGQWAGDCDQLGIAVRAPTVTEALDLVRIELEDLLVGLHAAIGGLGSAKAADGRVDFMPVRGGSVMLVVVEASGRSGSVLFAPADAAEFASHFIDVAAIAKRQEHLCRRVQGMVQP